MRSHHLYIYYTRTTHMTLNYGKRAPTTGIGERAGGRTPSARCTHSHINESLLPSRGKLEEHRALGCCFLTFKKNILRAAKRFFRKVLPRLAHSGGHRAHEILWFQCWCSSSVVGKWCYSAHVHSEVWNMLISMPYI